MLNSAIASGIGPSTIATSNCENLADLLLAGINVVNVAKSRVQALDLRAGLRSPVPGASVQEPLLRRADATGVYYRNAFLQAKDRGFSQGLGPLKIKQAPLGIGFLFSTIPGSEGKSRFFLMVGDRSYSTSRPMIYREAVYELLKRAQNDIPDNAVD